MVSLAHETYSVNCNYYFPPDIKLYTLILTVYLPNALQNIRRSLRSYG